MAKGISVGVGADTRDFSASVASGVIDPLQRVKNALDEIGAGGEQSSDKLTAQLKKEQDATAGTQHEYQALADTIHSTMASATHDVQHGTDQQTEILGVGIGEQKRLTREGIKASAEAATASVAQSAAGFDGTLQGALGTLENMGSQLAYVLPGGLGIVAAVAVTAFGIIQGAITNSDEDSQQFKQDVAALTAEFEKSGDVGSASFGYILDQLQKLSQETDSGKVSLSQLFDVAKGSSSSAKDLAQAYAGQTAKLKDLIAANKIKLQQDQDEAQSASGQARQNVDNARRSADQAAAEIQGLQAKASSQAKYNDYLEDAAKKAKAAKIEEEEYAAAGGPALQEKADLVKSVNEAYKDGVTDVNDYIDAETGLFNVAAYITAMQAKQKALDDYKADLASAGLSAEAKAFLSSEGADAAAAQLAGYEAASPAQKAALDQIWATAGKSNADSYTGNFTRALPSTIPGPEIALSPVRADAFIAAAQAALNNKSVKIPTEFVTRAGVRVI